MGGTPWLNRQGGQLAMIHIPGPNEPPNAVSPSRPATHNTTIFAYPNPFASSLQVDISDPGTSAVFMYDVLGRVVWSVAVSPRAQRVTLADPALLRLPSGSYFLQTRGAHVSQPVQIIHLK